MRRPAAMCLLCVTALLLLNGGCRQLYANLNAEYEPFVTVQQTVTPTEAVQQVAVRFRAGKVTVIGDAEESVRIEAAVKLRDTRPTPSGMQDFDDHVRLSTEGDTVRIADAHMKQPDEKDWQIEFTVHVPAHLAVEVNGGVGQIQLTQIAGKTNVHSGVGDVRVVSAAQVEGLEIHAGVGDVHVQIDGLKEALTVDNGTGDITAHVVTVPPTFRIWLNTGVGDATLRIPNGTAGRFDLDTGVGNVRVQGLEGLTINDKGPGGDGGGQVGEGGPEIKLETGVGDVSVAVVQPDA
jgi:hypothetical protein